MKKNVIIIDILLAVIFILAWVCFAIGLPGVINQWEYAELVENSTLFLSTFVIISYVLTAIICLTIFILVNLQIFKRSNNAPKQKRIEELQAELDTLKKDE